jgi:hypothetical protein
MLTAAELPLPPRCAPRWTRARIEAAIRPWTEEHGRRPRSIDFQPATAATPHRVTVIAAYNGSFNRAVEAAGVGS